MICGTCRETMKTFTDWKVHIAATGCDWGRPVWIKVGESKRRGHSGRRHLSRAYPELWKSEPMTEEAKARLKELSEQRIKVKKSEVKKVGRRR